MDSPPLIVLAVDGLRAAALGCYGNTTFPTPAFDLMASKSVVFDRHLASQFNLPALYDQLVCQHLKDDSKAGSVARSVLITDESYGQAAEQFGEAIAISLPDSAEPAASVDDTLLAKSFGQILDQLERSFQQPQPPNMVWIHSGTLLKAWDAPRDLIEALLDEDDPEPEVSVTPASGVIDRDADADQAFMASCRYAAQVQVLDACLDALEAFLGRLIGADRYHFAVLGLRGYAFGEHGTIGCVDSLYAEMREVPLLVKQASLGNRTPPPRRSSDLMNTAAAGTLLANVFKGAQFSTINRTEEEMPVVLASDSRIAYCTPEWRLMRPSQMEPLSPDDFDTREIDCELYSKPDDRWDQNDVASLCPEVIAELIIASNELLAD